MCEEKHDVVWCTIEIDDGKFVSLTEEEFDSYLKNKEMRVKLSDEEVMKLAEQAVLRMRKKAEEFRKRRERSEGEKNEGR